MSTVRQHLGLLWLLRRRLMTSNPNHNQHWAMQAALFVSAHLAELIDMAGGAEIEEWVRKQGYEIPDDFPHAAAPHAPVVRPMSSDLLSDEKVVRGCEEIAAPVVRADVLPAEPTDILLIACGWENWKPEGYVDRDAATKRYNAIREAALAASPSPSAPQGQEAAPDDIDQLIYDTLGDHGALPPNDGAPERIIKGREQVLTLAIRAILSKIYAANRLRDVRGLALDGIKQIDTAPVAGEAPADALDKKYEYRGFYIVEYTRKDVTRAALTGTYNNTKMPERTYFDSVKQCQGYVDCYLDDAVESGHDSANGGERSGDA